MIRTEAKAYLLESMGAERRNWCRVHQQYAVLCMVDLYRCYLDREVNQPRVLMPYVYSWARWPAQV